VEEEMKGVVNENPESRGVPPVAEENQNTLAEPAVAFNSTLPGPHELAEVTDEMEGIMFTVAVTGVLGETHPFK